MPPNISETLTPSCVEPRCLNRYSCLCDAQFSRYAIPRKTEKKY